MEDNNKEALMFKHGSFKPLLSIDFVCAYCKASIFLRILCEWFIVRERIDYKNRLSERINFVH